jgi:hypothetical protein
MASPQEIRDVLLKAVDRLERDGWLQQPSDAGPFWSGDDEGPCCAAQAIVAAAGPDEDWNHPAYAFFARFVGVEWIHDWNDTEGRTQAEVVAALRKAADLALEAGGRSV